MKCSESFHGNQYTSGGVQNGSHQKTKDVIAEKHGIGSTSVQRAEQFSQGLDAANEISPGFRDSVLTGTVKAPKSVIASLPKLEEPERKKAVQAIQNGGQVCRNLLPFQRSELALKMKEAIKAKAKANQSEFYGNQHTTGLSQKSEKVQPIHTDDELSKMAGVSRFTIRQAEKIISEGTPATA